MAPALQAAGTRMGNRAPQVCASQPLNDLDGASHALAAKASASGYMDAHVETYIGEPLVFDETQITPPENRRKPIGNQHNGMSNGLLHRWRVRRLTPIECERLQGFPDGFTNVPHRGKPAADGPRYKALGNSMACNVMRWIGWRISEVDKVA